MSPLTVIDSLRESDQYIETIFMTGSCYRFHVFLKALFPKAIPYMTHKKNHIFTKIGNRFYDILGEAEGYEAQDFTLLTAEELEEAKEWSFAKFNSLKLGECSYCDEPIIV